MLKKGKLFDRPNQIDLDGVDTIYFLVTGGSQNFPPFRPTPPAVQ